MFLGILFFIKWRWQRTDQLFLFVSEEESLVGGNKISTGRQVACCGNLPFYKCVINGRSSSHFCFQLYYVFIQLLLNIEVRSDGAVDANHLGICSRALYCAT